MEKKKNWKRKFLYYRHAENDCTLIWEKVGYKTIVTANLWIWEALQSECSGVANWHGSHAEERCGWGQSCFKPSKATWDRSIWYGSGTFSCSRPLEAFDRQEVKMNKLRLDSDQGLRLGIWASWCCKLKYQPRISCWDHSIPGYLSIRAEERGWKWSEKGVMGRYPD